MRLHILSNSFYVNSGFSKVALNIALGLKKLGYDVSATGLQTAMKSDYHYGIESLPIDAGSHIDEIGQLYLNLQKTNPDVLLYVGQMDTDTNHFTKVFGKIISYTPVEGRNIGSMMTNDLKYIIDHGGLVVAQCKFGQEEMKRVGVNAGMIYHGYDPSVFKKIDSFEPYCYYRTEIGKINTDPVKLHEMGCYDCRHTIFSNANTRCQYYKEEIVSLLKWDNSNDNKRWMQRDIGISKLNEELKGREKRFIYIGIFQNNGARKRIERLLKAYALLINESKQLKDRTRLHLHTLPISIQGVNLIKIISELGINDNVTFSYGAFRSSGWSETGLNVLYNLADVNVSASSSEGFGLPILESMACGVPNIGPDCSSFTELIGNENDTDLSKNRGLLAKIESHVMIQDGSERALVDEYDLALKMKKMYIDDDLRELFGINAEKWVKQWTWEKICKDWNKLLESV